MKFNANQAMQYTLGRQEEVLLQGKMPQKEDGDVDCNKTNKSSKRKVATPQIDHHQPVQNRNHVRDWKKAGVICTEANKHQ